jgi:hypothetical protein
MSEQNVIYAKFRLCEHSAPEPEVSNHARCADCQNDIDERFAAFWQDLIFPNGELDLEELKGDLCDYSDLIRNVSKVYSEVTQGRVSKVNTRPEIMITLFHDYVQRSIDDALKCERESDGNICWRPLFECVPPEGKMVLWQQARGEGFLIGYLKDKEHVFRPGGVSFEWLRDFEAWSELPKRWEACK